MKVILATRNPSKLHQINEIFQGSNITVMSLDDAGIQGEAVEDGETLEANALKKARFAREHASFPYCTVADDTGIFIDALNGKPGVYSARWAGEKASTEEATQFVVGQMKGIANRAATFKTVVALISPTGKEYFFFGEVAGKLLDEPRVAPQPKMPYSPLFIPFGEEKTWAEMTTEYENKISHRGIAFRKVKAFLESME